MKEQSKQWTSPNELAPKKAKIMKSAGTVMATIFWDARGNSYWLPSVEANDQWWLLCNLIGLFQQYFKEKTSPFGKKESALPSRQCTDSHVPGTDGQIQRIASPSSIFARFSLLRLFPVSKPEMVQRKEIHHQRAAHRRNRGLFWRVGQIILFGRLEKVGESLDQVYRAERRLYWEIKMNRSKKCVLLCFSKNLLTCPRNVLL